ncbi:MAG: DNA-3-methyladenine glycosylase I [Saprospiraceae bacterium]
MKEKTRCTWCEGNDIYIDYHDNEWGVPVHDDRELFEMIMLEGAQAGLSWITVLKKREGYRKAFDNFDAKKVAKYTDKKLEKLRENPNIIRNKLKIASARTNAKLFLEVQKEFGSFDKYIWQFVGGKPIKNKFEKMSDVPATTPESDAMSKDLKKRGFKFVGSTICYAFMQACGMVNDHITSCHKWKSVNKLK